MRLFELDFVVENRQQYRQMLQKMLTANIITDIEANSAVDFARKKLKRNDRIVWWLKWWRALRTKRSADRLKTSARREFQDRGERSQKFREIQAQHNKIAGMDLTKSDVTDNIYDFEILFDNGFQFDHIAQMLERIPQAEAYVWDSNSDPDDIWSALNTIEENWKQQQRSWIAPEPNDKIVHNYNNGYAWVLLDRAYCDAEGRAMGHCGNAASYQPGERILSFRTIKDDQHKPHLTFILDASGILGEMKGRANTKPDPKYHFYILDLLKQPYIQGIKGGGYASYQNFSIQDLSIEQLKELFAAKPRAIPQIQKDASDRRHLISQYLPFEYSSDRDFLEKLWSDQETQDMLIKQNPEWALVIPVDMIGEKYQHLQNKLAYAIVTEPGLTSLQFDQLLTKQDYLNALTDYGEGTFDVKLIGNSQ